MTRDEINEVLAKPYAQQLLTGATPARFAYVGLDGDPRVVPIAFHWNGSEIIVCTVPTSAKVPALRAHPRASLTIDTDGYPPKVLLVRGDVTLEIVDGVPEEYLAASRKLVPDSEYEQWKAGVTALYDQMCRVTVTPTWVKLLDFETTIPKAVQDLVTTRFGAMTGR